ncbi:helix-turn-helix domain-containing protein [Pasteurella sp. PK-2025]|uniref:helix-turn-helix domain-containing protein n=1 Tax=Pasteurella sp. PK-2025 TaxID=3413133 RepID=UPI003C756463
MKQRKIHLNQHLPYLSGDIEMNVFRSGLSTKYSAVKVTQADYQVSAGVFSADLRLVVTLSGISDIRFENGRFWQDARKQPKMAFLPISRDEKGWKYFACEQVQQEFVVFISRQWLRESLFAESPDFYLLEQLFQQHLNAFPLLATSNMLSLVKGLTQIHRAESVALLAQESHLLALLAEAFKQVIVGKSQVSPLDLQQFKARLEQGEFDQSSLSEMAKACHTNVTTLQRQFKQLYRISIGAYLRQKKLERGYDALLQGASVMAAAELAGYSNPDNFSTAFRRQFSLSPRQLKQERLKFLSIL